MRILRKSLVALAVIAASCVLCYGQVPEKPTQASPIVDLAGIINNDSLTAALNAQLDTLSKHTQNQVVVVTVNDMGGMDPKEFATELGNKWGIGGARLNNGLVMVVKPKNENGNGQIGFATGYGMEGSFPDVFCKRLQVDYMIPHFKEGDYAGGIKAAIDEIVPVVLDDYKQAQALKSGKETGHRAVSNWWIFIVIGVLLFLLLSRRKKKTTAAPSQPAEATGENAEGEAADIENGGMAAVATGAAAAGAVATAAASTTEASTPEEEPAEDEEENEEEPEEEKEEEKPYKYNYGGGNFGGGGASTEF